MNVTEIYIIKIWPKILIWQFQFRKLIYLELRQSIGSLEIWLRLLENSTAWPRSISKMLEKKFFDFCWVERWSKMLCLRFLGSKLNAPVVARNFFMREMLDNLQLQIAQIKNSKSKLALEIVWHEKFNAWNARDQCFCRSFSTLIWSCAWCC